MKAVLVACLIVTAIHQSVHAHVTAEVSDFDVDCGTDEGGPIRVTYTNPNPGTNLVVKMSSPGNQETCADTGSGGVFTIADPRGDCVVDQPDVNKPLYYLQVTLQEFDGVYQQSDPTFKFECSYYTGNITLTTFVPDGGPVGSPVSYTVNVQGNPDRTYTLQMLDSGENVITEASFGDDIFIRVQMDATDADEQGVQVPSCLLRSGNVSRTIIEDFCVVAAYQGLFQEAGFISEEMSAKFPLKLFALEGSDLTEVQFECVAVMCPTSCAGENCVPQGKRKRQVAGDTPTERKAVTMATKLKILPFGLSTSGKQGEWKCKAPSSMLCTHSLAFIVTVTVLALLLFVAMVIIILMFTIRHGELQMKGP